MTQVNRSRATEEALRSLALCDNPAATTAELGWEEKAEGDCVVRNGCIKDMNGAVLATWTGTWWEPTMYTDDIAPKLRDSYLLLILHTEIARAAPATVIHSPLEMNVRCVWMKIREWCLLSAATCVCARRAMCY